MLLTPLQALQATLDHLAYTVVRYDSDGCVIHGSIGTIVKAAGITMLLPETHCRRSFTVSANTLNALMYNGLTLKDVELPSGGVIVKATDGGGVGHSLIEPSVTQRDYVAEIARLQAPGKRDQLKKVHPMARKFTHSPVVAVYKTEHGKQAHFDCGSIAVWADE